VFSSYEEAIAFRTEFGLDSSFATVTARAEDGNADTTFGVPLSPAEAENMATRMRLQEASDEFAGVTNSTKSLRRIQTR
jgi:hypothetical protein